ncbi:hypothetical protein T08_2585 [Trichinella sp. T8]|nr:hypothetical protein T08_2585 [Trichinella sp. T8]
MKTSPLLGNRSLWCGLAELLNIRTKPKQNKIENRNKNDLKARYRLHLSIPVSLVANLETSFLNFKLIIVICLFKVP